METDYNSLPKTQGTYAQCLVHIILLKSITQSLHSAAICGGLNEAPLQKLSRTQIRILFCTNLAAVTTYTHTKSKNKGTRR